MCSRICYDGEYQPKDNGLEEDDRFCILGDGEEETRDRVRVFSPAKFPPASA